MAADAKPRTLFNGVPVPLGLENGDNFLGLEVLGDTPSSELLLVDVSSEEGMLVR